MANEERKHLLHLFSCCPKCGSKRFVENTEKSKRCEDCGFEYFMNPSASTVAVIVDEMDRLLVVRRSKEPAKGTLDLPGGFCDCYETGEEGHRDKIPLLAAQYVSLLWPRHPNPRPVYPLQGQGDNWRKSHGRCRRSALAALARC